MSLEHFGWNEFYSERFREYPSPGLVPARVVFQGRDLLRICTGDAEYWARVSGKLRRLRGRDLPVCGDWVAAQPASGQAVIRHVLPRVSCFSRGRPGSGTLEQVIAANIDVVFLMTGLDGDFNLRRIERYLVLARESGAQPVVLLNKEDVCVSVEARMDEVRNVAGDSEVHAISALHGWGFETLSKFFVVGRTIALLGSSGVGKSTLLNRLLGRSIQRVQAVVDGTDRGRHTTSARHLFLLPRGGLILDTPGLREVQLWVSGESLHGTFGDIAELAIQCRFNDCSHGVELGCAVRGAVAEGRIDAARLESYFKLQRETERLEQKQYMSANRIERERWRRDVRMRARLRHRP